LFYRQVPQGLLTGSNLEVLKKWIALVKFVITQLTSLMKKNIFVQGVWWK